MLISLIENALAEYDPFVVSYIFTSYGFNEQNTISFFTGRMHLFISTMAQ